MKTSRTIVRASIAWLLAGIGLGTSVGVIASQTKSAPAPAKSAQAPTPAQGMARPMPLPASPGMMPYGGGAPKYNNMPQGYSRGGPAVPMAGSRGPMGGRPTVNQFAQRRMPISNRIAVCSRGGAAIGGCAVWGGFQNVADRRQLNDARQRALAGGYAMTPVWIGADGVSRQVIVVASAPAPVNVVFLPVQDGDPAAFAAGDPAMASGATIAPAAPAYNGYYPTPNPAVATGAAPVGTVAAPAPVATGNDGASTPEPSTSQVDTTSPLPNAADAAQYTGSAGAASVHMCRNITTTANVAGQTDNATELWCRNDQGDYAPATQVGSQ